MGEGLDDEAGLAERAPDEGGIRAGELAYGPDAKVVELVLRGGPHVEEVSHRSLPHEVAGVVRKHLHVTVRLVVVASELGEDLVPRVPDGARYAKLVLYAIGDGGRDGADVASPQTDGPREVEPRLVGTKGLHEVRVVIVDAACRVRVATVELVARRDDHRVRTGLTRLPERHGRLDAATLCLVARCQHNAMPELLVSAHDKRAPPELGPLRLLDARIEGVHVTV